MDDNTGFGDPSTGNENNVNGESSSELESVSKIWVSYIFFWDTTDLVGGFDNEDGDDDDKVVKFLINEKFFWYNLEKSTW